MKLQILILMCIHSPAKKCNYQANENKRLKRHIADNHKGIIYSCDEWDQKTERKFNLNIHKQVRHEGVRYKWD